MIQDPRVGYTQIPLHYPGRGVRTEECQGGASSDLPRKCAFCSFFVCFSKSLSLIVGKKVIK